VSERSPEEREAARHERERRRAERAAGVSGHEDAPLAQPGHQPPVMDGDSPLDGHDTGNGDPMDDDTVLDDDLFDGEAPVGTKRVTRRERLAKIQPRARAAKPKPRAPKAPKRRQLPRKHRHPSRTGRIISLLALVVAAAVIWFFIELYQPFNGSAYGSITVTIPPHSSASQIGDLLERDGVISSSFFFNLRATLDGDRSDLRAGTYHLQHGMTYGDVLGRLTTAPPPVPTTTLTLVEGQSRAQIAALLHHQGVHGSYLAATRHSRLLDPTHYGAPRSTPSLEGFLFPSTYQLRKPVSIPALVDRQLVTFKRMFGKVKLGYARSHHLTAYDVVTIASIIEKEAGTPHDQPLVASVIYNRLRDHMPLGMDSTTRYQFNDYTRPLTQSQLASRSPYNTRLHTGLPPTPIANPGLAALQAAAHPARTNYLYFVVKVCGNHSSVFTSSYQQFLRDSAKYQSARAQNGGNSPTHC
jgi:uncharacterized YceG family protein